MADEDASRAAERAIQNAKNVGDARRVEQERILGEVEQILWEAKDQPTIDAMVRLARHILIPGPKS